MNDHGHFSRPKAGTKFQELPQEIMLAIVDEVWRQRDLNALVQSSHRWFDVANVELYRRDAVQPDRWALHWACWKGHEGALSKALEAGSPIDMYGDCIAVNPSSMKSEHRRLLPLELALSYGYSGVVKMLLEHGAKLHNNLCLNVCIEKGYDGTVATLARHIPGAYIETPMDTCAPGVFQTGLAINAASIANRPAAVEILAATWPNGFETSSLLDSSWGLMCAAQGGSLSLVKRWFEWRGNNRTPYGKSAWDDIWRCANFPPTQEGIDLAEFLKERSPRLKLQGRFYGQLTKWCKQGNVALLKWLLALPELSQEQRDRWLSTTSSLRLAIESKSLETVEIFLTPELAKTSLNFVRACRSGSVEIVQAFVRAGVDPCMAFYSERSCMSLALEGRDDRIINFLLDRGVSVAESGLNVLFSSWPHSRRLPKVATIRRLIDLGGKLDSQGNLKLLMVQACEEGSLRPNDYTDILEMVKLFLEYGADINATAKSANHKAQRDSPLAAVCRGNNINLVQFLIKHGANVNSADEIGETPLHHACSQHNPEVVQLLLESGAEPDAVAVESGMTPLLSACAQNLKSQDKDKRDDLCKVIMLLIEKGADVNARNKVNLTATHILCSVWFFDMNPMHLLLVHGAPMETKDDLGDTPLHRACTFHNAAAARILLEYGVKVRVTNVRDEPPLWKVFGRISERWNGDHGANIADLMLSYGADMKGMPQPVQMQRYHGATKLKAALRRHDVSHDIAVIR